MVMASSTEIESLRNQLSNKEEEVRSLSSELSQLEQQLRQRVKGKEVARASGSTCHPFLLVCGITLTNSYWQ